MMELNYIILAHKYPSQLYRLISRLNEPWVNFYIHIDKKINISPFENLLKEFSNVYLLKDEERFSGIWGDIGIVKATLKALAIIASQKKEGYCILMTGQDYPLKSNVDIQNFLNQNNRTNFISIFQKPENWDQHYLERINKYKINKSIKRGHFLLLSSIYEKEFYSYETLGKLNFLRKAGKFKAIGQIFKRRTFPNYIKPYGGGVYFALPMETIHKILAFHSQHPDFLNFNTYTLCADEVFFHSIIMKIDAKENLTIAPSLTYVNWERPTGPLPATFTIVDFAELSEASKNYLWARKFDKKIDREILNKIDSRLLKK